MTFTALALDTCDGVATVTLCRPTLLNRFDAVLHDEFADALEQIGKLPSVRAVLLRSEGKVFSAGGDFDLMRRAHADVSFRRSTIDQARNVLTALSTLRQPIVAAVQGPAVGLGATVTLACDVVVAARSASLADAHVGMALAAGDGGALFWPQSAGMLRARRYLLTGDSITASEAYQFGLVTDLVESADDVRTESERLARHLADLPAWAVQSTKRILNQSTMFRANEVVETGLLLEADTMASSDLLTAIDAFESTRGPRVTGR